MRFIPLSHFLITRMTALEPGIFLIMEVETNSPHLQLMSMQGNCGQYQRGKDSTRYLF